MEIYPTRYRRSIYNHKPAIAICFIGIGSNIDAVNNMITCARALRDDFPYITFSSVYRTAARDELQQDDFLNAVVKIETDESPEEVHFALKSIEEDLKKDPPYEKGPRTIDLDILIYKNPDNQQLTTENLIIPHPRMHDRRFVLEPLCELIDPNSIDSCSKKTWNSLLLENTDQKCEKVEMRL
jgi:2-amino-4-hydroxy-6-hydroxymethyldihydropteridine diphosphokinase